MHYIVVDLEWNQPLSFDTHVYREVGDRLIFEMIQIGAVKVGENLEVVDSISIPIRPTHYVKIHPRIRKMTQLGAEELADAPQFLEAMEQFAAWCGEDYTLLTWGCDDVSVLKQNMDFFGCQVQLPPLCDIQRLFSDVYKCRERKGLKAAMEMLDIQPDESRYFHNALHDAYYTALVFARLPNPADVLKYPQQPRSLIHTDKQERRRGHAFASIREAFESEFAREPRCPICAKKAKLEEEGYVRQTADKYIGLAKCPQHGMLLVRVKLSLTHSGERLMSMNLAKAAPSNRAYVRTKRMQQQQRDAEYEAAHGHPRDPEAELALVERSSMPFDD
ncbi:MAG: exonuclease domain-containing protein [Aristaeellaceae bacterium]